MKRHPSGLGPVQEHLGVLNTKRVLFAMGTSQSRLTFCRYIPFDGCICFTRGFCTRGGMCIATHTVRGTSIESIDGGERESRGKDQRCDNSESDTRLTQDPVSQLLIPLTGANNP